MASDRLRGPNHQPWCNGIGSWFSGQGYNRVRVCPCGAEDHAPELPGPATECRLSEPEPSPRELAIRELEALLAEVTAQTSQHAVGPSWRVGPLDILSRIEARLAKLREVRP